MSLAALIGTNEYFNVTIAGLQKAAFSLGNSAIENALGEARANEHAASLQEEAESERIARVKLEAQVQPRTISESDRKALGKKLSAFANSLKGRKVKIQSQTSDAEGMLFALEMMDIIQRAGIAVDTDGMGRLMPVGGVMMGARVSGPAKDQEFIKALVYGVRPHVLGVEGDWNSSYTELVILVGAKPIVGMEKDWLHKMP